MKKLFTLLLAIVLFALPACTQDPFLAEDDIVDSTQDIVIDFDAFVEERNAVIGQALRKNLQMNSSKPTDRISVKIWILFPKKKLRCFWTHQ